MIIAGVGSLAGCNTSPFGNLRNPRAATQTQDVADTPAGATAPTFATAIGGSSTNNKGISTPILRRPAVCDQSSSWDFPVSNTSKDGYQTVAPGSPGNGQLHVCSYAIMNGPNQQDLSLYQAGATVTSGNNVTCNPPPKPFLVYHLAPYEVITRGSGIGTLYSVDPDQGICAHRSIGANGGNAMYPLSVEFTYAIYLEK
jgi:hypothetical protein